MATEKRLISLDEALDATHKEVFWTESEQTAVRSFLLKLPRADAVEVVHGRWEDRENPQWKAYDIRHCSVCGWSIPKTKLRQKDAHWNYCPNCGADMRGDGNG